MIGIAVKSNLFKIDTDYFNVLMSELNQTVSEKVKEKFDVLISKNPFDMTFHITNEPFMVISCNFTKDENRKTSLDNITTSGYKIMKMRK